MITEDVVREKLPAIRHRLQFDFTYKRSMLRGTLESLEMELRAGGWRELKELDSQFRFWTADNAREPILVVLCPRIDEPEPYTGHSVDLRDLNVQGVHADG